MTTPMGIKTNHQLEMINWFQKCVVGPSSFQPQNGGFPKDHWLFVNSSMISPKSANQHATMLTSILIVLNRVCCLSLLAKNYIVVVCGIIHVLRAVTVH